MSDSVSLDELLNLKTLKAKAKNSGTYFSDSSENANAVEFTVAAVSDGDSHAHTLAVTNGGEPLVYIEMNCLSWHTFSQQITNNDGLTDEVIDETIKRLFGNLFGESPN